MSETTDTTSCANVDALVAYLYGEANEMQASDFKRHLQACDNCRTELAAFGNIREGIGTWRDAALNRLPASEMAFESANEQRVRVIPNRSAIAALREFFTLSPMWLRGATAFASLLFVTLLVVTAMQYFERPETSVAKETSIPTPRVESMTTNTPKNPDSVVVAPPNNPVPAERVVKSKTPANPRKSATASRANSSPRTVVPVLSNEERSQLSDLLIAENENEEQVPRLYDLLGESN